MKYILKSLFYQQFCKSRKIPHRDQEFSNTIQRKIYKIQPTTLLKTSYKLHSKDKKIYNNLPNIIEAVFQGLHGIIMNLMSIKMVMN